MKHTYKINGMTCNGCRNHVEQILSAIDGVKAVEVDLQKKEAVIEMDKHIHLEVFQKALAEDGGRYSIVMPGNDEEHVHHHPPKQQNGNGVYYCPMHCEGEKTYDQPGDCPVCGMDLVEQAGSKTTTGQYTCPMHPEIVRDEPGNCPICGMDLVPVEPEDSEENTTYKALLKKLIIAAAFTLPIFLIAMSEMIPNNPLFQLMPQKYWNWVQFTLSLPVVFYATWMFFERAWRSIRTMNLNMFTLIGIGAGVAWVFSLAGMLFPDFIPDDFKSHSGTVHIYFEAATVILTLVLLGQVLEARAHSRTNGAIKALLKLAPNQAVRIVNDREEVIAIDQIKIGDYLKVKPGEKVPVDGLITEGDSTVDESMITGEPIPVTKGKEDEVVAGTINGNGTFVMKAQKIGSDTILSQIIEMVNKASRSRAPIQKLADKISGYFVPIVILIAIITFIIWVIFGPEPTYSFAFINAISVLIIACPCALGLATPMSVMVGVGKGAQSGVLIKNAEILEKMNKIDVLIVDKTGTLTEGKPSVEKVVSVSNDYSQDQVLELIYALNQSSEHPLAAATVRYAKEQGIQQLKANEFNAVTGKGVTGLVNGQKVALGNDKMMQSANAAIKAEVSDEINHYQQQGKTVSIVSVDETIVGYVVISDAIKKSSKQAIAAIQKKGVEVIMLTGDQYDTAKAVADQMNLTQFKAGVLPEDKLKEVEQLHSQGKLVAMAGDGINDAPALALADVGIAMGTGTDVAIESAGVTLVKGDLDGIDKAFNLSHKVMKNIKQNLFFALVYNTIGIPIAAGLLYPIFGMLLSPMIAAAAMSFSSVSVIANALRLRTVKI
ncbi:MAG: heavy metal translocating P-type ATPase [Chitinophagales bacterium]